MRRKRRRPRRRWRPWRRTKPHRRLQRRLHPLPPLLPLLLSRPSAAQTLAILREHQWRRWGQQWLQAHVPSRALPCPLPSTLTQVEVTAWAWVCCLHKGPAQEPTREQAALQAACVAVTRCCWGAASSRRPPRTCARLQRPHQQPQQEGWRRTPCCPRRPLHSLPRPPAPVPPAPPPAMAGRPGAHVSLILHPTLWHGHQATAGAVTEGCTRLAPPTPPLPLPPQPPPRAASRAERTWKRSPCSAAVSRGGPARRRRGSSSTSTSRSAARPQLWCLRTHLLTRPWRCRARPHAASAVCWTRPTGAQAGDHMGASSVAFVEHDLQARVRVGWAPAEPAYASRHLGQTWDRQCRAFERSAQLHDEPCVIKSPCI